MKTYKENLRAYLGVIEMCEKYNKEHGTDVKPWECVKYRGGIILDGNPLFNGDADKYTFAIAILEAKPVFVGDKVWFKNVKLWSVITESLYPDGINDKSCSWNPPTVIIDGVVLPRPLKEPSTSVGRFTSSYTDGNFYFSNYQDYQQWEVYFVSLLIEARDKEN